MPLILYQRLLLLLIRGIGLLTSMTDLNRNLGQQYLSQYLTAYQMGRNSSLTQSLQLLEKYGGELYEAAYDES